MNAQRRVQRGFKIAGHRFGVAVPAGLRHALRNTLPDMRTGVGGIKAVEKGDDGLQVGNVLLGYLLALRDCRYHFAHIGGQFRNAFGTEVIAHALIQHTLIGAFPAQRSPEFLPRAVVQ